MILISISAAFVGFFHSLSPGHWIPVVMMGKSKKWTTSQCLFAAFIAASGHILISIALGGAAVWLGATFLAQYEERLEHFSSLILILFGLGYSLWAYRFHSHCHDDEHSHHGPRPKKGMGAYTFLFLLGVSPCVAALPVFIAAAKFGLTAVLASMLSFIIGVLGALIGATFISQKGLSKLDHPVLEHYGEVITGLVMVLVGLILYFFGGH